MSRSPTGLFVFVCSLRLLTEKLPNIFIGFWDPRCGLSSQSRCCGVCILSPNMHKHMYMHVCIYMYIHMVVQLCVYVYIHIKIHVCTYMLTYIYRYIWSDYNSVC